MASDEGLPEALELLALGSREDDRCPQRHQNRRVAGGGEADEPPQRVERAIGVTGARARSFWLGALHHARVAALIYPEDVTRLLDDDPELVVVLTVGQTGPVSRRADLDEKDRRYRQGRYLLHVPMMPHFDTAVPIALMHDACELLAPPAAFITNLRRHQPPPSPPPNQAPGPHTLGTCG